MIRPRRGRHRQFRSLASQITLLVSIPLVVLLAAAAFGSLLLNHNSRLGGSRSTNDGLADATAVAARAIRVDAFALLRQAPSGGEVPAPFAIVVDFERGDRSALVPILPRVPTEVRPAISRVVLAGPGETLVAGPLIDVETGYADLVFAAGGRDGRVTAGIVHIAPTSLANDWRRFVADRLGEPDETDLALVDANAFVLFHTSPERAGRSIPGIAGDDQPPVAVASEVRTGPDGEVAITSTRPVGDGWHVVVQRPWAGWREALNGPGLPVVFMLVASALITTALLTLSASRLTRPLRDLAEAARAIAAGDFTTRPPPIRTGDEVEDLADQFDIMAAELESLYSGLEQRVASRTAELQAVVDLAGAVSRTFDAGQVAGVAEARLQQHPGITAAAGIARSPTHAGGATDSTSRPVSAVAANGRVVTNGGSALSSTMTIESAPTAAGTTRRDGLSAGGLDVSSSRSTRRVISPRDPAMPGASAGPRPASVDSATLVTLNAYTRGEPPRAMTQSSHARSRSRSRARVTTRIPGCHPARARTMDCASSIQSSQRWAWACS